MLRFSVRRLLPALAFLLALPAGTKAATVSRTGTTVAIVAAAGARATALRAVFVTMLADVADL